MIVLPPKLIEIEWQQALREYHIKQNRIWLNMTQGEGYAMNYLLSHPDSIEPGLTLAGVEVYLRKGARADLVFLKGEDYYVVEAEESTRNWKVKEGRRQAVRYAKALEAHLRRNRIKFGRVVPIVAAIRYDDKPGGGYYVKQSFSSEQIKSILGVDGAS
jgi:hypothetical protein